MCPASLIAMFRTVASRTAGGAGAVAEFRRRSSAKQTPEPPTPSFEEWVAAVEASVPSSLTGMGSTLNPEGDQ